MGSLLEQDHHEFSFVLTGFSKFYGVQKNPTEELVNEIKESWRKDGNDTRCFYDCSVLKVSAATCDNYLAKMADKVSQDLSNKTVFWVHLGVDPGGTMISLESRAMNNASFMSPDEDGCQFLYQQIDKGCSYDQPIQTNLNIDSLAKRLEISGVTVRKSCDAGRFICNWIYYRSLRQNQQRPHSNWHSLFVHVPQFHQISKETQLFAIKSLFKALIEESSLSKNDTMLMTDNDSTTSAKLTL